MDLSSLKGLFSTPPGLGDYLNQGKTSNGLMDSLSQTLAAKIAAIQETAATATDPTNGSGVSVSLSDDAKAILAAANSDEKTGTDNLSGVQKSAQSFAMSFFDQNNLDLTKLSPEALDLIKGLEGVIGSSGLSQRDLSTDTLEQSKSDGNKKVFTLVGSGSRLRIAIEYNAGKPQKLSITDINNGKVETADFTLSSSTGKVTDSLNIERTQREYTNGHLSKLDTIDPLTVDLYKS